MTAEWSLYMVRCQDGSLYTGITTDIQRRLAQHQKGTGGGAKYTRGRGPLELVFQTKLGDKSRALSLENKIKNLSKAAKEELIKDPLKIKEIQEL